VKTSNKYSFLGAIYVKLVRKIKPGVIIHSCIFKLIARSVKMAGDLLK